MNFVLFYLGPFFSFSSLKLNRQSVHNDGNVDNDYNADNDDDANNDDIVITVAQHSAVIKNM